MTQGLGCYPDPPKLAHEKPDWLLDASTLKVAPPSFSLRELVLDVLNQGRLGSCAANATLQAIRMRHVAQDVPDPMLGSRLMLYYLCRAAGHTTNFDSGTYLRLCFEMLNKFGFCPEEIWPYDDTDTGSPFDPFRRMPRTQAFHDAFDLHAPTVYRRVITSGNALLGDLKRAIASGYPVPFGCDVSDAFTRGNFNPKSPLPPPTTSAGGHAMCFVGYNGDVFEVLNSWSTNFADDGYCWFSPEYVMTTRDQWIVEHAPVEGET